jgi:hypothetical protein
MIRQRRRPSALRVLKPKVAPILRRLSVRAFGVAQEAINNMHEHGISKLFEQLNQQSKIAPEQKHDPIEPSAHQEPVHETSAHDVRVTEERASDAYECVRLRRATDLIPSVFGTSLRCI